MPEAWPDPGQLSESDRESLVLDLWTRLQAARATSAAQGAEVVAARAVAEELRAQLGAGLASIAQLRAQVQALEARLGKPPKTPANSSLPPSTAEKPNKRRRRRWRTCSGGCKAGWGTQWRRFVRACGRAGW